LADQTLQVIEYEKCRQNPWYWLTTWVSTHDANDCKQPTKFFPEKDYLRVITTTWMEEPLLLIPKSRQMIATWLITALYLWDAMFHEGRHIFFQSKKEEDANALIDRAKFIYEHQPLFLKRHEVNAVYCLLEFPEINSRIRGIPEGGDQIRMHTASGIFMDEMAFQPEAEKAFQACKPTIDGGGRFTGVSSANPSFFQTLVEDK